MKRYRYKRKTFSPVDLVLENAGISVGVMGSTGLVGAMPDNPSKESIMQGMGTLRILPTVHAAGGVFQSLSSLDKKLKRF